MKHIRISGTRVSAAAVALGMNDALAKSETDQLDLERRLAKDKTKTKDAQALYLAKAGMKQVDLLLDTISTKTDAATISREALQMKLDSQMAKPRTNDFLILAATAQLIQNSNVSDVLKMFHDTGDIDILRAPLLIPVLKMNPSFSQGRETLTDALSQAVLGFKDHGKLQQLKTDSADLLKMESSLLMTQGEFKSRIEGIEADIVKEAA